jgi:hypothetical protein
VEEFPFEWLLYLAPIGVLVLVVWFVGRLLARMRRARALHDRLLREGQRALAEVVTLQHTGASISTGGHRHVGVMVGLIVRPNYGSPFSAEVTTYVSELQIPLVQPGVTVWVRFDPRQPGIAVMEALESAPRTDGTLIQQPVAAPPSVPVGAVIGLIVGLLGILFAIWGVTMHVQKQQADEQRQEEPPAPPGIPAAHHEP